MGVIMTIETAAVATPTPQMDYGDWVLNWWWPAATTKFSAGTLSNYRTTLNNLVIPHFGDQSLETIGKSAVRHWVSQLGEDGYSTSAIDSAIRVFRTTMMAALAKGLIDSNPLVGVKAWEA